MAPHIDIATAQVRAMGDQSRHTADSPLTNAERALDGGSEHRSAARLDWFLTNASLERMLLFAGATARADVTNIRSVGDKLHATADAIARGDEQSVDEFRPVPIVDHAGHGDLQ